MMIMVKKINLCEEESRFGTCLGCGKDASEDPEMVRATLIHSTGMYTNGGSLCLCGECRKLLAKGLTEGELYIKNPKRCGECEHLDYSSIYSSYPPQYKCEYYSSYPPQYKCEYYGCIVSPDDICKKEKS